MIDTNITKPGDLIWFVSVGPTPKISIGVLIDHTTDMYNFVEVLMNERVYSISVENLFSSLEKAEYEVLAITTRMQKIRQMIVKDIAESIDKEIIERLNHALWKQQS